MRSDLLVLLNRGAIALAGYFLPSPIQQKPCRMQREDQDKTQYAVAAAVQLPGVSDAEPASRIPNWSSSRTAIASPNDRRRSLRSNLSARRSARRLANQSLASVALVG